MKVRWGTRKYSFMIIPDADGRVIRFKIPRLVIYFILGLAIIVTSSAAALYTMHSRAMESNMRLKAELSGKSKQYIQTVTEKDQTIIELQSEVLDLKRQADEIKVKIDQLKKLESDIMGLSEGDGGRNNIGDLDSGTMAYGQKAKEKPVVIASFGGGNLNGLNGVGGGSSDEEDDADMEQIVSEAKSDFSLLDDEMQLLFDGLSAAKEKLLDEQELMRITPSLWPTVSWRVTSKFGYRKDPFTFRRSFHTGIDIAGNYNDPVFATADGKVQFAGWDRLRGNNIIINHSNGIRTWYMHLNKNLVKKGETVKKGDKIGRLGSTGRSTGPHLHYEVIKNGESIDPAPYMTQSRKDED
jgi:murein DD-endopeptidase MepM/ murein hydrolase activator NlpD